MKEKINNISLIIFILSLFLFSSCRGGGGGGGGTPGGTTAQKTEWTILVYMNADNDLEISGMIDLFEMAQIGSSDKFNVVIEVDRSPNYYQGEVINLADWTSTKRLYVKAEELQELEDLGELNLGDPQVLKDFITWAISKYPANKYAIILWNHGDSWTNFGIDETDKDFLTLPEISQAFAQSGAYFNLIGFDACLMGSLEVAYQLRNYGNILVVSEETEPGLGWDYQAILNYLTQNPTSNAEMLGQKIVDSYKDAIIAVVPKLSFNITLASIDLKKIDNVISAFNRFVAAIYNYPDTIQEYIQMEIAMKDAEEYGKANIFTPAEFYDLYDIAKLVGENVGQTDPDVANTSSNLRNAIDSAVLYTWSGSAHPESHGLSIWMPEEDQYTSKVNAYSQLDFAQDTVWSTYLLAVYAVKSQDTTPASISNLVLDSSTLNPGNWIFLNADLSDDNLITDVFPLAFLYLSGVYYAIAVGEPQEIYSETTSFTSAFDGMVWLTTDDTNQILAPVFTVDEVNNIQGVFGQYIFENGKIVDCLALFDGGSGQIIGIYQSSGEISPQSGDQFSPYAYIYDPASSLIGFATTSVLLDATNLKIQNVALTSGDYWLAIIVHDFGGNAVIDGDTVTVP